MKAVQYFSDEYLAHSAKLTPEQTLQFLEDFRLLHSSSPQTSTAISLRVPDRLLRLFRAKAKAAGMPYQTQIKRLMEDWLRCQSIDSE